MVYNFSKPYHVDLQNLTKKENTQQFMYTQVLSVYHVQRENVHN